MRDFHVREKYISGDEQGCELMGWAAPFIASIQDGFTAGGSFTAIQI